VTRNGAAPRPRVLFVGRMRYHLPLPEWLSKKWDAVEEELDYRLVGAAAADSAPSDLRFRLTPPFRPLLLDGLAFYLRLPFRLRRHIRDFRPHAIFASDPVVGAAALLGRLGTGVGTRVIVEVHGDWRTFARAYGAPSRRLIAPFVDVASAFAVRRADATRAVSSFTSELVREVRGREPSAVFTAFSDLSAFTAKPIAPLPQQPTVVFVGSLEPYKNIAGLAEAWRLVSRRLPDARLVIVGRGSQQHVVDRLVADFPDRVEHHLWLDPPAVSDVLDDATMLVLPSWPEGLGRVVIEAFARGRAVVATDAGGIPDLVTHEREGLLVPPADPVPLAAALERVLGDRELAERMGKAAHVRYADWDTTPEELARHMRSLVDAVVAGTAR
jgi:glycosyltransferase involved in cell wall biosynthesis